MILMSSFNILSMLRIITFIVGTYNYTPIYSNFTQCKLRLKTKDGLYTDTVGI